ncbi:flavodoxin family protein [Lacrimispora indolis]|uniref:flavodoxin family protein n=1 Tax=Lacrimispora indolis TaxID=69825 RepID=UPI000424935D|nr:MULTISPECIES: flavodoxin [Lachnospiraceae]MBE7718877.1 flavodoxin [Lacrimispora celerecrescens]
MSTLVVYFSFTGSTKFIAEKIAETMNADIAQLKTSKEYPADGFKKYFFGGKSVIFGEKPDLVNEPIDWNRYDTIIIGTPVWAGSFAPPIKSFISQYKIRGKRIALFASHGGGGAKKCFAKLKKELSGNEFICEIDFVEPKKNREGNTSKAVKWARSIAV